MLPEMELSLNARQEGLRETFKEVLYGTTKLQRDIVNEIGISQYTYRNFMIGKDIGRISMVKIEEWLMRQRQ